jgi:DNA-binding IclR family transcriptional regulator
MRQFYRELLRRDRKTGHYFCPAQNRNSNQSAEEAQLDAICEVLELAVCAATDRISVTTFEEVLQEQELLKFEAERLREMARDMKRPAVLGALALDESSSVAEALQDLETLYRMADRIERFVTVMRRPNDFLVVDKHRGDPTVRGVQILIGAGLERQFGKRLDGTAATLTGAIPCMIALAIPDRIDVTFIEAATSTNLLGLRARKGNRVSIARTAAGHAYAAALDPLSADHLLLQIDQGAPKDAERLRSRLEPNRLTLKERGSLITCGLFRAHLNGIAVPFWSSLYGTYVVLTMGVLAADYDEPRMQNELAPIVLHLSVEVQDVLDSSEVKLKK